MAVRNDNAESEACLLGCIILQEDAADYCVPKLTSEDFDWDLHRRVFKAMAKMHDEGKPIDPVTLRRRVGCKADEIRELTEAVLIPKNYKTYLHQVQTDANLRILSKGLTDAASQAASGTSEDAWNTVETLREQLVRESEDQFYDSERLMTQTLSVADAYMRGDREVLGVSTGWSSVDAVVGGLIPGNMWVVAGRPGQGKSAWAANLLVNVARGGHTAALVSLEMSATEIGVRLLCREAGLNWQSLRDGKVHGADTKMVEASETLAAMPMVVIDQPRLTVGSLRSTVRHTKPSVVIVDYVQLMAGPTHRTRSEEVAAISRGLKILAREERVCVIAMAQLNRNVEMRGEGASPVLADLKDSGSLEQDPDIVAFLCQRRNTTPYYSDLDLEVAKNRNGVVTQAKLAWTKGTVTIEDLTTPTPAAAPVAPHLRVAPVPAS